MRGTPHIVVIDYSKGNLQSVEKGLVAAGYDASVSADPAEIATADGLVLPGVGAFYDAMAYMDTSGQSDAIREQVSRGVPLLGICLGMQVMFESGDEGSPEGGHTDGLGFLPGTCSRLTTETEKIPHVGWNTVDYTAAEDLSHSQDPPGPSLFEGLESGTHFYFTHAYRVPKNPYTIATTTDLEPFPSAVVCSEGGTRLYGVQFHPEKSSTEGLCLLANFGAIVAATINRRTGA